MGIGIAVAAALAGSAGAVPAPQVVASYPQGSVDAFDAGYGYAAWSVSGRRAGGTAVVIRDPDGKLTTIRLRSGSIRDLRVVRGPAAGGDRDVAIAGMRCGPGDAPDCVPFALDSRTGFRQHIAAWVYPVFAEHRRGVSPLVAIEDGRTISMEQETAAPRGESPPDRCAVTLTDGTGAHRLPPLEGCWRTDKVELKGRTVLVTSNADLRDCATCTEGLLRALDLGDPAAGWKVLAAHTEHAYETRGVVSAVAIRDGAIGLSGGPSVGVAANDPDQPVTLRHWTVGGAGATPPVADPSALLPPRRTVDWQQVVSTGSELLALTVDRKRRRTAIVRVPLDLGAMKDADAVPVPIR